MFMIKVQPHPLLWIILHGLRVSQFFQWEMGLPLGIPQFEVIILKASGGWERLIYTRRDRKLNTWIFNSIEASLYSGFV